MGIIDFLAKDIKRELYGKRYKTPKNIVKKHDKTPVERIKRRNEENEKQELKFSAGGQNISPQHNPTTMKELDQQGLLDADLQDFMVSELFEHTMEEVQLLCDRYGLSCHGEKGFIYIKSEVGKWYFKPQEGQITLYHKNYNYFRNSAAYYHIQFTRSMEPRELISYIYRHDRKKLK